MIIRTEPGRINQSPVVCATAGSADADADPRADRWLGEGDKPREAVGTRRRVYADGSCICVGIVYQNPHNGGACLMSSGSNRQCYPYERITHRSPTVFWFQNSCPKFRVFVSIPTCPIPGHVAWEYSRIFKHRVSAVSPSVTVARVDIRTLFPDQLHMNYINTRLRSVAVDFTVRSVKVCVRVNTSACCTAACMDV